ncbi:MAG: serine/threonine protein kinase [Phycisphaerae bacterium]|jgi:hypothetical protein
MAYTFKHGDRPLDGLTIQRAVGRGGFGEVYYALSDSGKQLAVKYLRENPEIELRGIAQVMNLKSPHLVTIYDVRRGAEDEPFVIMEYISGPSLRDLLQSAPGGLGEQKAVFFVEGIGKGLAYLHERGIVHRDLKPGNIFYDDGYVKIGDYGLSKHISVSAHSGNTVSVGTVHYMAPEIGSGSYTKAIDIYALGVILYELLTGRLPFTGSSMGEVLMRHLKENPDVSGIRAPFAQIINKALAKNPGDRYQDANEMIDALMAVAGVRETLSTFDPLSISTIPRASGGHDPERTQTSPPGRAWRPELDVRDLEAGGLPPIPPIPPIPGARGAAAPSAPHRPARHEPRIAPAPRGELVSFEHAEAGNRRGRWAQGVVVLMMAVATAIVLALTVRKGSEETGAAIAFMLLGGTLGVLAAHFKLVRRMLTPHPFIARAVYAMTACILMAPGMGIAADANASRIVVPLLVSLLVFDWGARIERGRRGLVDGGSAIWHGVVGLVVSGMVDAPPLIGAGMCLVLPLLAQTAAAIWPAVESAAGSGPSAPRQARGADRILDRAAEALETAGKRIEERFGHIGVVARVEGPRRSGPSEPGAVPPPIPPIPSEGAATVQPVVIDAYEPSFVGRTANAGLGFIGKLLLVAGLALAVLMHADSGLHVGTDRTTVALANGTVLVRTLENQDAYPIPRAMAIAPVGLGTLLLLVSRRRSGAAHLARGLLGGAFGLVAVMLALGPSSHAIELAFAQDWETLFRFGHVRQLAPLVGIASVALLLLFWPRRKPGAAVVTI